MQVTRISAKDADVDAAASSYLRFLTLIQPDLVVYATNDGVLAVGPHESGGLAAIIGPKRGRAIGADTGAAFAEALSEPFVFALAPAEAARGFVGARAWQRVGVSQEMIFCEPPVSNGPKHAPKNGEVRPPSGPAGARLPAPFEAWMDAFVRELFEGPMRPPPVFASDLWTMWEGETPVSMAGALGRGADAVRIVTVYTPPELRGRGYATALVTEMARAASIRGARYVTLDYSLEAPSPRSAYERAGFRATVITERWSAQGGTPVNE